VALLVRRMLATLAITIIAIAAIVAAGAYLEHAQHCQQLSAQYAAALREPAPAAQTPVDVPELNTEVTNWTAFREGARVAYTRQCGG